MNVYALNEHNTNINDWRKNVENIIPCLNKELSNNSFKLSRWLVASVLAGVDYIKFAFVSRKNMSDPKKHVVLATHTVKTREYMAQNNLEMKSMWNKLKFLVETVTSDPKEQGTYIMIKDHSKLAFRLYRKPEEEGEEGEAQIDS